jgi:hypothetical protein
MIWLREHIQYPGITIEEVVFNGGEEFLPIFSISNDCAEDFRRLGLKFLLRLRRALVYITGVQHLGIRVGTTSLVGVPRPP